MSDRANPTPFYTPPRPSATFDAHAIAEIQRAAATGIYDIRGAGAKRKVPHFDDLLFLGASISRYPLEGYREKCGTDVVLGDAGDALGDSLYEARLFVRGTVNSLGADCIEKPLSDEHKKTLGKLLEGAGLDGQVDPSEFRRYGSARQLYHFHMDNLEAY